MPVCIDSRNHSPRKKRKSAAFSLLILLSMVFFVLLRDLPAALPPSGPAPEPMPWQRVKELLDSRTFVSGDELFQLLYILYNQDRNGSFRLDRHILSRLQDKNATLFPLAGCEAIEVQAGEVIFRFAAPQQVVVPNTWRQASLHLSDRLVLTILDQPPVPVQEADGVEAPDPDTKTICFQVREGAMQLHFSFLLQWLGGRMRDAEGTELLYQINEAKRISRLQLIENTPLTGDRLKISRPVPADNSRGMQWIDIEHPDFPGVQDIGIDNSLITFLGTEVELLPDRMIRIGRDKPMQNDRAWHWFTNNIKSFRDYAETGQLATTINYTRNFGYHFEERQVVVTMGFHSADEKQ